MGSVGTCTAQISDLVLLCPRTFRTAPHRIILPCASCHPSAKTPSSPAARANSETRLPRLRPISPRALVVPPQRRDGRPRSPARVARRRTSRGQAALAFGFGLVAPTSRSAPSPSAVQHSTCIPQTHLAHVARRCLRLCSSAPPAGEEVRLLFCVALLANVIWGCVRLAKLVGLDSRIWAVCAYMMNECCISQGSPTFFLIMRYVLMDVAYASGKCVDSSRRVKSRRGTAQRFVSHHIERWGNRSSYLSIKIRVP